MLYRNEINNVKTPVWGVGGGYSIKNLANEYSYNYRIDSQELLVSDRGNAKSGDLWFNGYDASDKTKSVVIKVANGPNTPYQFILDDKGFLGLIDKDGNKYATLYAGEP